MTVAAVRPAGRTRGAGSSAVSSAVARRYNGGDDATVGGYR
ncbi:hypothetical protein J2S66_001899 [Saccharothrix longispora]|uniref:Uncharacterized protein n=1 Tax=Saccharothrix longispora TaxID=33920 RepID=A0ABU1PSA1_9PSEU|nr:hypothetical protein [Saccharothrix longispora]